MRISTNCCTVQCSEETILAAFEWHRRRYAQGIKEWDVASHASMWLRAQQAFDQRSAPDFDYVYEELRRRWQVFRGGTAHWSSLQTFDAMLTCCTDLRSLRLTGIAMSDVPRLWQLLQTMRHLKDTKNGPSTVAVSKFLHFWNPRLFVIVDDAVVWKWVFAHHWVLDPIRQVRERTDTVLFGSPQRHADHSCDLETYLAVLVWASTFLLAHPQLLSSFADYVHCYSSTLPEGVDTYEAAAIEWFLLGLVEIPPHGWSVSQHR